MEVIQVAVLKVKPGICQHIQLDCTKKEKMGDVLDTRSMDVVSDSERNW